MNERIAPWKCDEGDVVEFHFSKWAKDNNRPILTGTVTAREEKYAIIKIDEPSQSVRVHVSLVKVVKPAFTEKRVKKALLAKFGTSPTNNKKHKKERKEVVAKVGGMTFAYKK